MHHEHTEVLNTLAQCAAACEHCTTACLQEEDISMTADCIRNCRDCADVCRLTASFIARGSAHADQLLHLCGEICSACARECEKHAHMEHCRECADLCRKCAEACSVPV